MHFTKLFDKPGYRQKNSIWNCLQTSIPNVSYKKTYDSMHTIPFAPVYDGSYQVLAQMAKGNLTLDLACGDGYLASLAPDTTVALDFSYPALLKAKRNGAKHLVLADVHKLPFRDLSFDLCICSGSLEHFSNPLGALEEMHRVSRTQIIITHKPYPIPFANFVRTFILKLLHQPDQPNDRPLSLRQLHQLFSRADMYIVYEGVWTYPYNLEVISSFIPRSFYLPSCTFIISTHLPHSLYTFPSTAY